MSRRIAGLSAVAADFGGVLFDQYGVLHDGKAAFAGALDCLAALHGIGVPAVVVTNSGRSAATNLDRLAGLGFGRELFGGVITSGDLAAAQLAQWRAAGRLHAGASVAVIARGDGAAPLSGLDLRTVAPDAPGPSADLLLISGAEPERFSRAGYAALLAPLAARAVPALCVNPDRAMYTAQGPAFGPGIIAEDYAAASGRPVVMLGKPASAMFAAGLAALGQSDAGRVLMVGDSPEHDIAGAAALGCRTLLIESGIQAGLDRGAAPDFVMRDLVW